MTNGTWRWLISPLWLISCHTVLTAQFPSKSVAAAEQTVPEWNRCIRKHRGSNIVTSQIMIGADESKAAIAGVNEPLNIHHKNCRDQSEGKLVSGGRAVLFPLEVGGAFFFWLMLRPNGSNATSHPFIQVPAHLQKRQRSHDDLSPLIYGPSSKFSAVFFIRSGHYNWETRCFFELCKFFRSKVKSWQQWQRLLWSVIWKEKKKKHEKKTNRKEH